jgi:hypothetical protein
MSDRFFLRLAFLCLFQVLFIVTSRCQEKSETPSAVKFRAKAGVILNRAFSHYGKREEFPDESSLIQRKATDSSSNVRIGFVVGGEAVIGRSEKMQSVLGLSFTRSSGEYHYTYYEEIPTVRPGFSKLTRNTEHDIFETYYMINVEAALRNRLWENFFLTSGLVFSNPVQVLRWTTGYTETLYVSSGTDNESYVEFIDEQAVKKRGSLNLSLRLRAEYQFPVFGSEASVFLFRNFGFVYKTPWWGMGLIYTIR